MADPHDATDLVRKRAALAGDRTGATGANDADFGVGYQQYQSVGTLSLPQPAGRPEKNVILSVRSEAPRMFGLHDHRTALSARQGRCGAGSPPSHELRFSPNRING